MNICNECKHCEKAAADFKEWLCLISPIEELPRNPIDGSYLYKTCIEKNKDGKCDKFQPIPPIEPAQPSDNIGVVVEEDFFIKARRWLVRHIR